MAKVDRENQNTEWKENWQEKYLEWICGMANCEGGTIYFGYDDKGTPIGLSKEDIEKLLLEIPKKVKNQLGIIVDIKNFETDGLECLKITVDKYPTPISYHGKYYLRSGSNKFEVTGPELDRFMNVKLGKTWDGSPYPNITINDLDNETIEKFRKMALKSQRLTEKDLDVDNKTLLKKLHLYENGYLTAAAILLFHEEPTRYFTGPTIKVGFFEDNDADLRYQDEIDGPLITQVDRAVELIYMKYLKALIWYEGIYRREEFMFPMEAFREILLNAVNNKHYDSGIPIQVSVYEDKIYVFNTGEFNKNIDIKTIYSKKHSSYPYNPKLALSFFKSGQIESWGRGFEKIKEKCNAEDVPLPIVDDKSNPGIMIKCLPSEKYIELLRREDLPNVKVELTEKEQKVFNEIVKDNYITRKNISSNTSISERTIATILKRMQDEEIIERIGSDKKGYWKLK